MGGITRIIEKLNTNHLPCPREAKYQTNAVRQGWHLWTSVCNMIAAMVAMTVLTCSPFFCLRFFACETQRVSSNSVVKGTFASNSWTKSAILKDGNRSWRLCLRTLGSFDDVRPVNSSSISLNNSFLCSLMPVDVFNNATKANLGSPRAMYLTIVALSFLVRLRQFNFSQPRGIIDVNLLKTFSKTKIIYYFKYFQAKAFFIIKADKNILT